MPTYFCPYCGRETPHLNVKEAAATAQVTRGTIYNWIRRAEVHCVRRPSGRRFVCAASLLVPDPFHGRTVANALPVHTLAIGRRAPGRRPSSPRPGRTAPSV